MSSSWYDAIQDKPIEDSKMRLFYIDLAAAGMAGLTILSSVEFFDDDERLVMCFVSGSIIGSFGYILHKRLYRQEDVLATFLGNTILAYLSSSVLCDILPYFHVPTNFRTCFALSGVLAWSMPWLLLTVIPEAGKKLVKAVRKISIQEIVARLLNIKIEKPSRKGHDDRSKDSGAGE